MRDDGLLPGVQFCSMMGTGRAGSCWLQMLFRECGIASALGGIQERLKPCHRGARAALFAYFANVWCEIPEDARIYVEGHPVFLEWLRLYFGTTKASIAIPAGMLERPPVLALLVRHPFGYVKSIRAIGWHREWWTEPGFTSEDWDSLTLIEKASTTWVWRNAYFLEAVESDSIFRFEDIFGDDKELATSELRRLGRHFGFDIPMPDEVLVEWLGERIGAKGGYKLALTEEEQDQCREICAGLMGELGYA